MTRDQAEEAVEWVLGIKTYAALVGTGVNLPERLKMAALKAFRENWPNQIRLEYIRRALNMLANEGMFTFEED